MSQYIKFDLEAIGLHQEDSLTHPPHVANQEKEISEISSFSKGGPQNPYLKFDPEANWQNQGGASANLANVANQEEEISEISNVSNPSPANGEPSPTSRVGLDYCVGCGSAELEDGIDMTTCRACGAWWMPSIDLRSDAPEAFIRRCNPKTGQVVLIGIHRCTACREVRWGPRLDDPDIWHCLNCAGVR